MPGGPVSTWVALSRLTVWAWACLDLGGPVSTHRMGLDLINWVCLLPGWPSRLGWACIDSQGGPDLSQVGLSSFYCQVGLSRLFLACLDSQGGPDLTQVVLSTARWACLDLGGYRIVQKQVAGGPYSVLTVSGIG